VRCEQYREALSARLDGEDEPTEQAAVDAHLASCPDCRTWADAASVVTRMARMSVVTAEVDLSDDILDAAPGPGRRRAFIGLRLALGAVGFAQFVLGIAQISVYSAADHDHTSAVSSAHLWHESAAWNVALGAGFGWIAARRSRPAGLIPLLTAFVALLALLSANDFWTGQVDTTRIFTHALLVLGYLIVLAMSRPSLDFGDPPAQRHSGQWSLATRDTAPRVAPRLRPVPRHLPQQTARHDEAA
jgi:predicted anti-sigma-YlaC factor YlaD